MYSILCSLCYYKLALSTVYTKLEGCNDIFSERREQFDFSIQLMQLGSAAAVVAVWQAKLQRALCFTLCACRVCTTAITGSNVRVAKLYDCNVGSVRG